MAVNVCDILGCAHPSSNWRHRRCSLAPAL